MYVQQYGVKPTSSYDCQEVKLEANLAGLGSDTGVKPIDLYHLGIVGSYHNKLLLLDIQPA